MLLSITQDKRSRLAFLVFLLFAVWWLALKWLDPSHVLYQVFSATYGVMALMGAIWGLTISKRWGGVSSVVGKALIFFSLGLFAQEFGQIVYSSYAFFLKVQIPYPSLGDLGYFGSIPLYFMGVYYLAKASGIRFSLKNSDL